ncbi:uncharacterized protein FIBRA_00425 [Fibroporia radiculosa]|uniref:F-box domain-containing protein n=1 Tax=Fibroporia radiculosa TaxID=599839 RepID=J4G076_9APHY|nr:uncharacterized protein FIBRA_00425 [Fibroporia radiculosa]CCL98428.1 predicted protein [Fibroporia radiculosa]
MTLAHSVQLPIELWEKVIDYVADEWRHNHMDDRAWMRELGRVCRGWHARCNFSGRETLDAKPIDKKQVYCLINMLDQNPERCRAIKMVSFEFHWHKLVGMFGSFAACMAQKLSRVFVHVTLAFGSVSMLELSEVAFSSDLVFGRLSLAVGAASPPTRHRQLDECDDVFDFLALIGAHLRRLSCHEDELETCAGLLTVSADSLSPLYIGLHNRAFPIYLTPAVNLRVLSFTLPFKDLARAAGVVFRASLSKLIGIRITSTFYDAASSFSPVVNIPPYKRLLFIFSLGCPAVV